MCFYLRLRPGFVRTTYCIFRILIFSYRWITKAIYMFFVLRTVCWQHGLRLTKGEKGVMPVAVCVAMVMRAAAAGQDRSRQVLSRL